MKSSFERMGGTYRQERDYLLPNIEMPDGKEHIGIWGQRRRRFLREQLSGTYTELLLSGKLNSHLVNIDAQAERSFSQFVNQTRQSEDISEQLKADGQMAWLQQMDSIHCRAAEAVTREIISRW